MQARLQFLKSKNIPLRYVLDVGAHHGEWYCMFKSIYPDAQIHCFEANPSCATILDQVKCPYTICLLGDKQGKETTYYASKSEFTTGNSIFLEQTEVYKNGTYQSVKMQMQTLDNLIAPTQTIDLIKLDVQGAELIVLNGALKLLERTQFVLLEASILPYNKGAPLLHEVIAFMDKHGFQVYDIADLHYYRGYCNQCDILFLRKSSFMWPILTNEGVCTLPAPLYNIQLSNGDRANLLSHLGKKKRENPKYTVIDVGGSATSWSSPVCDAYADINDPQGNIDHSKQFFRVDITDPSTWNDILTYVDTHGKFDFSICTHTLEDISHPRIAVQLLQKISNEGYIATPSKYAELCRFENGPSGYRGYIHHRWIFSFKNGSYICYPKVPMIEHEPFPELAMDQVNEIKDLSFFWYKQIPLTEVNNGYLGPTVAHVKEYYKDLISDDLDMLLNTREQNKR